MKTELSPLPNQITYQNFISDLGSLPETSMKVEKKSELIGRGGVYRRPVGDIRMYRQGLAFGYCCTLSP
jgi:hypothetical protein